MLTFEPHMPALATLAADALGGPVADAIRAAVAAGDCSAAMRAVDALRPVGVRPTTREARIADALVAVLGDDEGDRRVEAALRKACA